MGFFDRVAQCVRKLSGKPPRDMEYADYVTYYGWRNLEDVPRHELEAMCLYRRYVVMPQFKDLLEAFVGPQYRIAERMDSLYGDSLDIYERTGRQYLVGHLSFRGHYCVSWTSVNGGPLVRCPECHKLVQHETLQSGQHDCEDTDEWGTVDPDWAEHTKRVRETYASVHECLRDLDEAIKKIECLSKTCGGDQ